jgi:hypothetical protein
MSCYLIQWEGGTYVNDEMYVTALAQGPSAFSKMLACGQVKARTLFDQTLFPVTPEQAETCRQYRPNEQDFDEAFRAVNIVSADTVRRVKEKMESGYPNSHVITLKRQFAPQLYKYRQAVCFKVSDYKAQRKYAMLPHMASLKVCGRLYVALNAVTVKTDRPYIVTLEA